MYFQNISVNPIISKKSFLWRHHFGTLLRWFTPLSLTLNDLKSAAIVAAKFLILERKCDNYRFINIRKRTTYNRKHFFLIFCGTGILNFPLSELIRWLKTVSSTFQDIDFDGSILPLFISWCYNHGIKKLPNQWWKRWYHFRDTIGYHGNTMTC